MNTFNKEKFCTDNSINFNYGRIAVKMGFSNDPSKFSLYPKLQPNVCIYWEDRLICERPTLADALNYAYVAVRLCRFDLHDVLANGDRVEILDTLSAMSELAGAKINSASEFPEIKYRIQVSQESAKAFPSWDDVPQCVIYHSLWSADNRSPTNDGMRFTVEIATYETKFRHSVSSSTHNLPDLQKLVDELVVKHFA